MPLRVTCLLDGPEVELDAVAASYDGGASMINGLEETEGHKFINA